MVRPMPSQLIERKRVPRMGFYQTLEMDLQLIFWSGVYPCRLRP
jgi:hypothetical protein